MLEQLRTKPADLSKVWAMIKNAEQRQFTVRVPVDVFYKVQALEAMFPNRSRNELISDLLSTALNEFEDSLPFEIRETNEVLGVDEGGHPIIETFRTGLQVDFQRLEDQARRGALKSTDSKAVDSSESDA